MKKHISILTILTFILVLFVPVKTYAIPSFARKYHISCQVCHSPALPRLKGFGEEFAGKGFRMTDYESPRHFIETGDDQLSLFREFPVAMRMDAFASYNFGNQGTADFGSPFILKILSGGELSDKLSYYFYFFFNERGTIAGIEDAFLMYHDVMGSGVNLYLGQFAVSDPLFKGELRYTLEPYKIYSVSPGNSTANLKYDRGIIVEKDFSTGTAFTGEIINGNGIGEADGNYLFDKDKYKNFMFRVNQAIGDKVSAGFFIYTGKELLSDPNAVHSDVTNNIKMYGPDVVINLDEKLILGIQYLWRSDSHIFDGLSGGTLTGIKTQGGFAEIIYAPRGDMSKWYFTGLLNLVESDYNSLDYSSATFHCGYLLRRNMRVVAEFTKRFGDISYGKVNAGVITAF